MSKQQPDQNSAGQSSSDDRFEAFLRTASRSYRLPPEPADHDAMWAAIISAAPIGVPAEVVKRHGGKTMPLPFHHRLLNVVRAPAVVLPMAAGIILAIGYAGGAYWRTSVAPQPATISAPEIATVDKPIPLEPGTTAPAPMATRAYYKEAAQLLAEFETQARHDSVNTAISDWARDLLSRTQLLLDSRAAQDPARRKLLLDLELVLVQMVQLTPSSSSEDATIIQRAIDDSKLVPLVQSALPPSRGT